MPDSARPPSADSRSGEPRTAEPDHGMGQSAAEFSATGMAVKLVLLPGLLVLCLTMIAVVIGWLTLSPGDADSLVDALERGGNARWRAAVDLAGLLREPAGAGLKRDPVLAGRLAAILDREIQAGGMAEGQLTLRMYLCRALGEFHVGEPLPVLVTAATTERDPRECDVRRSAIEAIAVLGSHVGTATARSRPEVTEALLEASRDARPALRSTAAFALGVIGGPEAETRLETLLADSYPDVRYNAATGLARHGNAKAVDVLVEMLRPSEPAGVDSGQDPAAEDSRRAMIRVNALRATRQLAAANAAADLSRLAQAIGRLLDSGVEAPIRAEAVDVLDLLRDRSQ